MEEVLVWIVNSDLIEYINYFFAGFIGSLAGILRMVYEEDRRIGFWKLFQKTISNGIIGGFAGMFFTNFSDNEGFNFSISGLSGAMGFRKSVDFLLGFLESFAKGGKKNDKK